MRACVSGAARGADWTSSSGERWDVWREIPGNSTHLLTQSISDRAVLNLKLWKMAEFFQTQLVCFLAGNLVCLSRAHPGFDSGLQKDLVEDIKEGPGGSSEAVWRKHLDKRLISGQCWS